MNEIEIVPAILVKDRKDFSEKIASVLPYVKRVQIDIMDGKFVPNLTLQPEDFPPIPPGLIVEYHLMVENPLDYVRKIGKKGAIYELHIESLSDVDGAISQIRKMGGKVALAISPDTPAKRLLPYLSKIEHALIMTVYPGFSGQSYLPAMEEKIRYLRSHSPNLPIEIDGGAGVGSAKSASFAGANLIGVASAIFSKPDIKKAIAEIREDAKSSRE